MTLADAMVTASGHGNTREPDVLLTLVCQPVQGARRRAAAAPKCIVAKNRPGHKSTAFLRGVQCTDCFSRISSATVLKTGF